MNFDQAKQAILSRKIQIVSETSIGNMDCIFIDHEEKGIGTAVICNFLDRVVVAEKWDILDDEEAGRSLHISQHLDFRRFLIKYDFYLNQKKFV